MLLVDLSLPTAAENLALDEALLDEAEASGRPCELLRLWEAPGPMVVVGRSSQVALEVNVEACRRRGIPVLRRSSGGAAIVAGPGSLMYALVLSYELRPALHSLDEAHRQVLETNLAALRPLAPSAVRRGTSDLALDQLKFSGNSVRCKRKHLLYHGTLLYDFDLPLVSQLLTMPPRQPDYRQQRPHAAFIANLPLGAAQLRAALQDAWQAAPAHDYQWPRERVQELVATRYGLDAWNLQR